MWSCARLVSRITLARTILQRMRCTVNGICELRKNNIYYANVTFDTSHPHPKRNFESANAAGLETMRWKQMFELSSDALYFPSENVLFQEGYITWSQPGDHLLQNRSRSCCTIRERTLQGHMTSPNTHNGYDASFIYIYIYIALIPRMIPANCDASTIVRTMLTSALARLRRSYESLQSQQITNRILRASDTVQYLLRRISCRNIAEKVIFSSSYIVMA